MPINLDNECIHAADIADRKFFFKFFGDSMSSQQRCICKITFPEHITFNRIDTSYWQKYMEPIASKGLNDLFGILSKYARTLHLLGLPNNIPKNINLL